MEKIGFLEGLIHGIDGREREKLNEAAEGIGRVSSETEGNRTHIRRLYNLDRAQGEQLERLKTILRVFGEILVDAGVASAESIEARVDSALRDLEKKPDSLAGGPYRGGAKQKKVAKPVKQPKTTCARCQKEVLWIQTEATEDGSVCKECAD